MRSALSAFANRVLLSSQSVARLNTSWSNNPELGPRRGEKGGFAGRDDLEETRRYRGSPRENGRGDYRMVFEVPAVGSSHRRKRDRSRHRDRSPERRRRSRSRSPRLRRHAGDRQSSPDRRTCRE